MKKVEGLSLSEIAIITDSTSYIPKELQDELHITVVPLQVVYGNKAYREEVELTEADFYSKLKTSDQLPTTSQPPVGEFVEAYMKLSKTHKRAIAIHMSSGISGTYQGAVTATTMVDDFPIDVIDSEITTYAMGAVVVEAARMAQAGKPREEILERIEYIRTQMKTYFLVEDLDFLYRGGRLSAAQLMLGNMLKIKPILTFENKKIVPYQKVRTRAKAKAGIMELFEAEAKAGKPMQLSIIQAQVQEEAEEWKAYIEATYPHVTVTISRFGPVIATHVGPGAIGLTWYYK
ncbi:DegV family protein [Brevibacillus laterosporus]|uniref:DegV family protein n=1 Tax=Brevibacillus laterosporus TaxID=1465 RepID=UPI002654BF08|nr:DegV family protein [Brevibacillus laterosporus]MDN9010745.1 DegV family protein [Brevibacillus laterosporus]MDO0941692.1 DegV family protein [Brevibacillus laterosporus]